jgi:hypothetical protein
MTKLTLGWGNPNANQGADHQITKKAKPKRDHTTGIHQTAFSTTSQHTEKVMLSKEHEMLRG